MPRMKLIPGEGLKLPQPHLRGHGCDVPPNEANPWRGIETFYEHEKTLIRLNAPNEANPWRGIETSCCEAESPQAHPPNEANPWRGIETFGR